MAVRCWIEMQSSSASRPCVLLSEMNDRGVVAACEVDMGNAVTMHALRPPRATPATCLDWNNNYGEDDGQVHPLPLRARAADDDDRQGQIADHAILANALGAGLRVRLQHRPHQAAAP